VLLPVKTVGVMGDGRTYDNVCALRAVTSTDGMTADYYPFPHEFLGQVATRIINEVRGINRGLRRDLKAARDDRMGVSGLGGYRFQQSEPRYQILGCRLQMQEICRLLDLDLGQEDAARARNTQASSP